MQYTTVFVWLDTGYICCGLGRTVQACLTGAGIGCSVDYFVVPDGRLVLCALWSAAFCAGASVVVMILVAAALVFVYDVFAVFYEDGTDHCWMRSAYVKVESFRKAYGRCTACTIQISPSGDAARRQRGPSPCLTALALAIGLADES